MSRALQTWNELLTALGVVTREQLEQLVADRLTFDPDSAEVEVNAGEEMDSIELEATSTSMDSGTGLALDFPFTVEDFWQQVAALDAHAEGLANSLRLPFIDQTEAPGALAEHLSHAFGWIDEEVFEVVGGGWVSCDDAIPDGIDPSGQRSWYRAGAPALLVLGIGRKTSLAGRPSATSTDSDAAETWLLTEVMTAPTESLATTGSETADLLERLISASQTTSHLCHGCRRPRPPVGQTQDGADLCRDCIGTFS